MSPILETVSEFATEPACQKLATIWFEWLVQRFAFLTMVRFYTFLNQSEP